MSIHRHHGSPRAASLIIGAAIVLFAGTASASLTLVHEFQGSNASDFPYADLVQSGTTLFGTTLGGGVHDRGLIFSVDTDGSNYTVLHEFNWLDGRTPTSLTLSGTTLYGITADGGTEPDDSLADGTVFSIETDGSNFTSLYSMRSAIEGRTPQSTLVHSGTTLYGTNGGGAVHNNDGAIFSMDDDGTNFNILHTFDEAQGKGPAGDLTLVGSKFYGTTAAGGAHDAGVFYSIDTDGSDYTVLHHFAGGPNDGATPDGGLVRVGSTLYGRTQIGGDNDIGTLYAIDLDGSNYRLLHEFSIADGRIPTDLTLDGSTLYGGTFSGGANDDGTIFSINTDGSNFEVLFDFSGRYIDGSFANSRMLLDGSTLYGTTKAGGFDDHGTVFAFEIPPPVVPEPSTYAMAVIGLVGLLAYRRWR